MDFGFDADRVLTFRLDLGADEYTRERRIQFYETLVQRLESLPGVTAAGVSTCAPLSNACNRTLVRGTLARPEIPPEEAMAMGLIGVHYATAGSFDALGVPLLQGRLFDARDRAGAPRVLVINQAAARLLYPGQDPVGKPLGLGVSFTPRGELAEIIGVVGDVKYGPPDAATIPETYAPVLQAPTIATTVFVRTARDPFALADAASRVVRELDPDLPIFELATMHDRAADTFARARFITVLLGLFANLSLGLALIGLYGLLAYAVAGRAREIGVRVALGAARRDILRLVLRDGAALALAGLAAGTITAFAATRALSGLLFGVTPHDPRTFALAAITLLAAALLASWLPAHRAARTDPVVSLRRE
ncbi:MAG TPA: FtsX-like permease family protein [Longimicrobiales bacterium]|nr:FtsX-like permease family protein [Longimicrobiales bacterium]